MGFWGSMFGGSNPTLNQGMNRAGQTSTWAGAKGQGLVNQTGDFISGLMGGDPSKTAKLLAPQIGTIQKQGQQQKQTMSQFSNRSGGTNARAQSIDDQSRAAVAKMISDLTGQSVSAAGQMGQSLVDTGLSALGMQVNMSQQQMENWNNSIFGKGMQQAASSAESAALAA